MFLGWDEFIQSIFSKPYYQELLSFWEHAYATTQVFPPKEKIFNAFDQCPLSSVKVVLIGQDPYHDDGQAMGLSFSVPIGMTLPPSLRNIYKEIENDLDVIMNYQDGDLTYLAKQGVLLWNVNLTVEAHKPLSHAKPEYEQLTTDVIEAIETLDQPVVYLLFGTFAKKFAKKVYNPKHLVLMANHPSPLSANRGGFFGEHVFSRCNDYLEKHGVSPIRWGNALI